MKQTILLSLSIDELKNIIIDCVKTCLRSSSSSPATQIKDLLSVKEAAEFLNLSTHTIYAKVRKSEIPYCKPSGKQLFFSRNDLSAWVMSGKKKTRFETLSEVDSLLSKVKRAA